MTLSRSGILNFAAVAMSLNDLGYRAIGIRIDSGDLAYLSNIAREAFEGISKQFNVEWFATLIIVASNDINEDTILSLNDQGHSIDVFGIGTHLGSNNDQTFFSNLAVINTVDLVLVISSPRKLGFN